MFSYVSPPYMDAPQNPIDVHLQLALNEADSEIAQYHLREALQLRIARQATSDDTLSA